MAIRPPNNAPTIIADDAGNLLKARIMTTASGRSVHKLMLKIDSMTSSTTVKSMGTTTSSRSPINAYNARAMRIEGIVVDIMLLMWVIRSVPATAGARFVVSDSGEILSPK